MKIIDSLDIVSMVFQCSFNGVSTDLSFEVENNSTNVDNRFTFTTIHQQTDKWIELGIDWVDELPDGDFSYILRDTRDDTILDRGVLKVFVEKRPTDLPIYLDDNGDYVIYKN